MQANTTVTTGKHQTQLQSIMGTLKGPYVHGSLPIPPYLQHCAAPLKHAYKTYWN